MKGIIVGGGIGGLTLGIALHQAGIDATVYEAAPVIKPVGAGILLGTNAMLVMKKLGLDKKLQAAGQQVYNGAVTDGKGRILQNMPMEMLEKHFGVTTTAIHRGRLQQILIDALPKDKFIIDKRAISIENGAKPSVTFEDGTTAKGDFLIGADGIHSVVRQSIFPQIKKRYSGQTCWRGVVSMVLPKEKQFQIKEMWSKKGRFAAIQIAEDLVYWYAVQKVEAGGKDNLSNLHQTIIPIFKEFDMAEKIISKTPVNQIIRGDLYDLKPTRPWFQNNISLVGDAIHAMTPNLGQGGAQSIEDAFALTRCLQKNKDLTSAFQQYEKLRYPKAKFVVDQSRLFGAIAHWENPLMISVRNFVLRNSPQKIFMKQFVKLYEVNY